MNILSSIVVVIIFTSNLWSQIYQRPNIIFIFADDLGYGDLGSYGQELIQTPELDKMASNGMRFTRFYSGSALCLPSRVTLMTGLHTGHCSVRKNGGGGNHDPILEEDITVARVLQAAGYTTGMIGKWALGDEFFGNVVGAKNIDGSGAVYKHGFDYYFGEPNQSYNHEYYMDQMYQYDPLGFMGEPTQGQKLDVITYPNNSTTHQFYKADLEIDKVLAFIAAAKDKPFFLYFPSSIPHWNFEIPELEPYAAKSSWGNNAKVYASMITRLDRDIGRILDTLKALGLDSNTLVMFSSDNGSDAAFSIFDSNAGLAGTKGQLQEGGLRVPLIARWPGRLEAGNTNESVYAFWDLLPTWAELTGINVPQPIDGLSMVPILFNQKSENEHKYLYWELNSQRHVIKVTDTRDDETIIAEAHTEVKVPEWTPNVTYGCMDPDYVEYDVEATVHEGSHCINLTTGLKNELDPIEDLFFNTARSTLSIYFEGQFSIRILTIKGNLVYQNEGKGPRKLNISNIGKPGIYILQLKKYSQAIVKRIFME